MIERAFKTQQAQESADRGTFIEDGWSVLRDLSRDKEADAQSLLLARVAFFTGACHAFYGMQYVFGDNTTRRGRRLNSRRYDGVDRELQKFRAEVVVHAMAAIPTEGGMQ